MSVFSLKVWFYSEWAAASSNVIEFLHFWSFTVLSSLPSLIYCRILQNVACCTTGQNSKVGSRKSLVFIIWAGLLTWTLKEEKHTLLLLDIFIKTHSTNTQNTKKEMTIHFFIHFAVQHRHGGPNVAPSSLSISASVKWTVLSAASHAVHPLQQRCLLSFVGAFYLSFWSHIKKHVHTLSTFLLDWSIFFIRLKHYIHTDFSLIAIHLPIEFLKPWTASGQKKSFPFFFKSLDSVQMTHAATLWPYHWQTFFFSPNWYSWAGLISGKKLKYLHVCEFITACQKLTWTEKYWKTIKKQRLQSDKAL